VTLRMGVRLLDLWFDPGLLDLLEGLLFLLADKGLPLDPIPIPIPAPIPIPTCAPSLSLSLSTSKFDNTDALDSDLDLGIRAGEENEDARGRS